ncbi:MAG: ABC transporter permease [Mesorhizobium sp.]
MFKGSPVVCGIAWLFCLFLLAPLAVIVAVSFGTERFIVFPPTGFSLRWYGEALGNLRLIAATWNSVKVGAAAGLLAVVLGLLVVRGQDRLAPGKRQFFNLVFLLPVTVPSIVFAIGLMFFLRSIGLLNSTTGLTLGHTVVTFPYAVRMIAASAPRGLADLERAASILGASPLQVFRRITLPSLRTGVLGGFLFAFLISANNVTIALFVAGARTETLPVRMFHMTINELSPVLAAISTLFLAFTMIALVGMEKLIGVYRTLEARGSG